MSGFPERLTSNDLTALRQNTDWRGLFDALQIEKDPKKSRDNDWWGKSPFNPGEKSASFHLNDRGWYCHSTGQGGGALELVQRLQSVNCYEAGRWLLEHGVSQIVSNVRANVQTTSASVSGDDEKTETVENLPIRQDLRPQLVAKHPLLTDRGIQPRVLYDLGAGYLERPPRRNGRSDPMNRRLVFQIRGLEEDATGRMQPVIRGHIGRATTAEQKNHEGKWWTYAGFRKSLELYNVDLAVLEDEAIHQTAETGQVLIVEGCFDVAKLRAAGINNAVATFGAHLSKEQVSRLDLISELTGVDRFLVWYDRDQDGSSPCGQGAVHAAQLITRRGYEVEVFDWNRHFSSPARATVPIPTAITDPAEFSVDQLKWLRFEGFI